MNENVCSVCWDTFKFPKLLPCKHTFCISCLYEFLSGLQDKSTLVCPLCRESCYVPDKGFSDFPTNYFVPVEKTAKTCQECKLLPVSRICHQCNVFLCRKCDFTHSHSKKRGEGDADDSDSESIASLPFHLKWLLMHQNMKTEFLCKHISMFVAEFPHEDNVRKNVRSMSLSRDGGVYVRLSDNEFLLKYNQKGEITDRIPLLKGDASAILEVQNGLLLVSHFVIKSTVFYKPNILLENGRLFQHYEFAKTPEFYPLCLAELKNGNIVIGGPTHLCNDKCKDNDCGESKNNPGRLHVYSDKGHILKQIVQDTLENIFKFPIYIASSSKADTIAVCDREHHKVIIIDTQGKVRGFYKGWGKLPISIFPEKENFLPLSVCSTSDGNYVVADPRRECLHVLSPYGKFIGIMRCEDGEVLNDTSALCVDTENNVWVGHHNEGTITVLKPSYFRNVFDRSVLPQLPLFPYLGGESDIPFLP